MKKESNVEKVLGAALFIGGILGACYVLSNKKVSNKVLENTKELMDEADKKQVVYEIIETEKGSKVSKIKEK